MRAERETSGYNKTNCFGENNGDNLPGLFKSDRLIDENILKE